MNKFTKVLVSGAAVMAMSLSLAACSDSNNNTPSETETTTVAVTQEQKDVALRYESLMDAASAVDGVALLDQMVTLMNEIDAAGGDSSVASPEATALFEETVGAVADDYFVQAEGQDRTEFLGSVLALPLELQGATVDLTVPGGAVTMVDENNATVDLSKVTLVVTGAGGTTTYVEGASSDAADLAGKTVPFTLVDGKWKVSDASNVAEPIISAAAAPVEEEETASPADDLPPVEDQSVVETE